MLCKKGVFKNFADFIGKHLCWSFFLIKKILQHCEFCEVFKNTNFKEKLQTAASEDFEIFKYI